MDETTFQGFQLYPFLSFYANDFEIVLKKFERPYWDHQKKQYT